MMEDELLTQLPDRKPYPDEAIAHRRLQTVRIKLEEVIEELKVTLSAEDKWLLNMRFEKQHKIRDIAHILHQDRNHVSRRLQKILTQFKEGILARGFNLQDVLEIMEWKE